MSIASVSDILHKAVSSVFPHNVDDEFRKWKGVLDSWGVRTVDVLRLFAETRALYTLGMQQPLVLALMSLLAVSAQQEEAARSAAAQQQQQQQQPRTPARQQQQRQSVQGTPGSALSSYPYGYTGHPGSAGRASAPSHMNDQGRMRRGEVASRRVVGSHQPVGSSAYTDLGDLGFADSSGRGTRRAECEHGKRRDQCKTCGGTSICDHGRRKFYCKDCSGGGTATCEHGRAAKGRFCRLCATNPLWACPHGRHKTFCKDCKTNKFCPCGKERRRCRECGGSGLCEHGRQKYHCRICGGGWLCEHDRPRYYCKECGGLGICEHGKRKQQCKECGGGCPHGKTSAYRCKDCGGSGVCIHGKYKFACAECKLLPRTNTAGPRGAKRKLGDAVSQRAFAPSQYPMLSDSVLAGAAVAAATGVVPEIPQPPSQRRRTLCRHQQEILTCEECKYNLCIHGKKERGRFCKECKGIGTCEHGRTKYYCKECGGDGICLHGRRRTLCKDCGGRSICAHGKRRVLCKDCGGSGLCIHGRRKPVCRDCGGGGICEHGRKRTYCRDCGGGGMCEHGKKRNVCKDCNPTLDIRRTRATPRTHYGIAAGADSSSVPAPAPLPAYAPPGGYAPSGAPLTVNAAAAVAAAAAAAAAPAPAPPAAVSPPGVGVEQVQMGGLGGPPDQQGLPMMAAESHEGRGGMTGTDGYQGEAGA
eukprot:Cvel_12388.t1-p1 / transcript=Cvel_12388.t1 / gene=Cvel_12388 / organism=Chromera_velia_CCMP2878 / gene_product=Keratin-associated protein 5-3, putative / transcript_product=Keratin-associated protein 5-3, putative / location=Cvel_scaffold809:41180-43669(+) / protein_length=698 / sequence_SO=supercontig / SO=protein_coding / is_pseudo=false